MRGAVALVALLVLASCEASAREQASPTITSRVGHVVPDVDTSRSGVPLDEVYFDTFTGAVIPLSASARVLRERLLDAIPPIDDPTYVTRREADESLQPGDLVVGYAAGGDAFAYPTRILDRHEIVHDVVDGIPVAVTYCPLCGSGAVFDRRLETSDGTTRTLAFSNTSALYEHDLVLVDRGTGSYWWQVAGLGIVGPLTGERLRPLPAETTSWGSWRTRHPDTMVLSGDVGSSARPWSPYGPPTRGGATDAFADYEARIDAGRFVLPIEEAALDDRYAASQRTLGVVVGDEVVGVPVIRAGVASFDVAGVPHVALVDPPTARAFRDLPSGVRYDDGRFASPDGRDWSVDGVATDGSRLDPVPTTSMFWFAFGLAHPSARVVEPG